MLISPITPHQEARGTIVTGIVIFALVALFLGLRLYSVLGKRTGHEQTFGKPEGAIAPPISGRSSPEEARDRAPVDELSAPVAELGASEGLRAIAAADRTFSPEEFVNGAGQAYRLILEAYWKGQMSDVSSFIADDVNDAFTDAITARNDAGEVLDNRLITIERAIISAASLEGGTANITVRFDADIAAVTRNKEGVVIAGSLSDAVPTHDAWTFSRTVKASDPNWILTDTDEAS
jgi:predicted lipid-binding transport protein (Tim44 family)